MRTRLSTWLAWPDHPTSDESGRGAEAGAALTLGLAAVAVVYAFHVALYYARIGPRVLDDAFIYFRYADNLAAGHGPVYNPDQRVEGYTGFTWMVLLAAAARAHLPLIGAAQAVSALCGLISLVLTWRVARGFLGSGWVSLLPPLFLATDRTYCVWSIQGLETKLFGVLLLGSFALWIERPPATARVRFPLLGLLLACLALTRPEGFLFAGMIGLCALPQAIRSRAMRSFVLEAAAFVFVTGAHLAFRRAYYGEWLPNTFYAKVVGLQPAAGWQYLATLGEFNHLLRYAPLTLIGAVAFAAPGILAAQRRCSLLGSGLYAIYVVAIGGDYFEFRFFDVLLPFYALWTVAGCERIARLAQTAALRSGVLAVGSALWLSANLHAAIVPPPGDMALTTPEAEASYTEQFAAVGRWLARNAAPNDLIAIRPAGAIAYLSGARCLDVLGLNDRAIAHGDGGALALAQSIGHQHVVTRDYLVRRRVTYFIGHPQITRWPARPGRGLISVEIAPHQYLIMHRLADDARLQDRIYAMAELRGSSAGWAPPRIGAVRPANFIPR